ncbi:hypothetical protein AMATHDRAFT_145169 [Amanita thiersii Skay4041]|uniref:Ribosomal protein L13 n=1 Tax=Amanita thiersii Skay4041 TaxID=703135 RepID=A0A2A9NRX2_9AGAR|nr:hypothetical protein AMATHDRAFT_145169 [Amanita thiersii Skay4041]
MSQVVGNTALAYARIWHHVDARNRTLGKLAERIALVLMGKHKPIYDPSLDCGDYVVVTNASQLRVTGNKAEQLVYRKHSMYPGGLKETPYKDMMGRGKERGGGRVEGRSREVLKHAVAGMLPKNRLREKRLERLKVFPAEQMGRVGVNVMKRWEDGTLPPDYDPSRERMTTGKMLKRNWRTGEGMEKKEGE